MSDETKKETVPESLLIAAKGIQTGRDFSNIFASLIPDILSGRVTPQVANAVCNAGGKLLKIVEMQYKYGDTTPGRPKTLILASGANEPAV
jgi:hypothetical protein